MSTLEEKILDGPRVHYCEADDDDIRADGEEEEEVAHEAADPGIGASAAAGSAASLFRRPDFDEASRLGRAQKGRTSNTGPKGVLEDFRRQSLQTKEGPASQDGLDALEEEFEALLNDDSILREHIDKRIAAAAADKTAAPTFGHVQHLSSGAELLKAIDKEDAKVLVLVHIYTKYSRTCNRVNHCLNELAREFTTVKFVTLDASVTGLSANFKDNGVPALLAYRAGDLIKSLVKLEDQLDKDFETAQIREILIDNDLLY